MRNGQNEAAVPQDAAQRIGQGKVLEIERHALNERFTRRNGEATLTGDLLHDRLEARIARVHRYVAVLNGDGKRTR